MQTSKIIKRLTVRRQTIKVKQNYIEKLDENITAT